MRIVLLGGTGFLGSHLRHYLGDSVHAPSSRQVDLTVAASLRRYFRPGDIVINAAGYAVATDRTAEGRARFETVNVAGVRHLAEAALACGVRQLIHMSSIAAMGRCEGERLTETAQGPMLTPYAISKAAGEALLASYRNRLAITILRPTSVFGEGRGLAHTLCRAISRRLVPVPGTGRAQIPFSYVGNIAHAVSLAINNPHCFGGTFLIGDLQSYPLREILQHLAAHLGVRPIFVPVPVSLATAGVTLLEHHAARRHTIPLLDRGRLHTLTQSVSYTTAAFQHATGYQPPYTLADGTARIAHWYRGHCESTIDEQLHKAQGASVGR